MNNSRVSIVIVLIHDIVSIILYFISYDNF